MKLTFLGAAGEVTGSSYLVETKTTRVLVDFGIFQGGPDTDEKNIVPRELNPGRLDAVVLTHAHNDHVGRLPLLTKAGYQGPIFGTHATYDLANLILLDAAKVQAQDVDRYNRRRLRRGEEPEQPLYAAEDVVRTMSFYRPISYAKSHEVAAGVSVRLVDAGHMLGSSSIEMTIEENGSKKVVAFSGDLGPRGAPFLRDPQPIPHADLVILESTYGDRDHRPLAETLKQFREIVHEAVQNHGVILVPVFAVGRSQDMLYHLAALFRTKQIPRFPVYLDSPMAIDAVQIYRKHTNLFDEEAMALLKSGQLENDLELISTTPTSDDSRKLNDQEGPMIILAGSGMCNAGRILHHLKHRLWQADTYVVIVGYQGQGTLGRQLVDGAKSVNIHGDSIAVRAKIRTLGGFSAHAGQTELLAWHHCLAPDKPRLALTHGENIQRTLLQGKIKDGCGTTAALPKLGESLTL